MHPFEIICVAVGLGMDAMSVCMAIGVKWNGPHQKFRLAWHMGLFQFLMPVLGWLAGNGLAGTLRSIGGYLAAALVLGVGAKMLWEAIKTHPGEVSQEIEEGIEHAAERLHITHPKQPPQAKDPTRGWSLMALSIATSLDALVVGFSLGLQGQQIWLSSVVIGITAGAMSLIGVVVGKRLGEALGKPAEILGAAVLILLGVLFLWKTITG